MTVYRRNPLLMTVMGANPGPRRKRPVDDPIDHAIGQAWHRLMSGIQVSVMDIPRIFRDVKLEMAAGMPLEEAVMRVGARFQVNRNGYRRNPSLAASLAGGLAGAFVTHAMSNPGPSFLVIDSRSGVVQFRRVASGTGQQAFGAAHERARDMANKLGRMFYVFLDMHGFKVGTRMSLPMIRVQGATAVYPSGPLRNPLTEAEHREIMEGSRIDMGVAARYGELGNKFQEGVHRGRAARGKEIAHNFSPKSNPRKSSTKNMNPGRRVVARWEAKGGKRWIELYQDSHGYGYDSDNGGGYLGNLGSDENAIARMEHLSYGSAASLKADFPSTRRTLNPQSNPGPKGRRKITMTVQQFATWVKKKRDPAMWRAFLAKFRGYEKWTHGAKSRKVTLEWQNVPGMDGLWITYDGGKQPESTYIMPKGSRRKGAWKHPWDTMPDIKHDPEAGVVLTKLRGRSRISDFYHK